jgi:hypothetical protein
LDRHALNWFFLRDIFRSTSGQLILPTVKVVIGGVRYDALIPRPDAGTHTSITTPFPTVLGTTCGILLK